MKRIYSIIFALIIIIFVLNATICKDMKKTVIEYPLDIVEAKAIDYVYPTETLKQNFLYGIAICDKKQIAQNGAFESCILEQVKMKSDEDFNTLLNINSYCDSVTKNEADRRSCIDTVLHIE